MCNPQRAQEKREKLGAVIESIEKVLGQKIVIIIVTYITFTFCQHLILSKFQIAKKKGNLDFAIIPSNMARS